MAKLLLGREVADALSEDLRNRVERLGEKGIAPILAIVRVGENPGDLSYETGARKRAEQLGIRVRSVVEHLCPAAAVYHGFFEYG